MNSQPQTRIVHPHSFGRITGLLLLASILLQPLARGAIMGPYSLDANTLHLWHLNESAIPAVDAALGGTNLMVLAGGATLGNASVPGFGTALSTAAGTGAYLAARTLVNGVGDEAQMTYANPDTGAFTVEAVVRVDFNSATFNRGNVPLYIVTAENETATQRPYQLRMHTNGVAGSGGFILHFFNSVGNTGAAVPIPSSGPDAIAQGNWYHVAVTFDGADAGGNLTFYWTLMDESRVQANVIGTGTMGNLSPLASGTPDFAIGNVGRSSPNGAFVGLIDEVRLSRVVRSATDMMFNTAKVNIPVSIAQQPASQAIEFGLPATFTVLAFGTEPLSYQWHYNNSPITGATERTYTVPFVASTNTGSYHVVVTNIVNAITSDPATLAMQNFPAAIVADPSSQTVAIGQTAAMTVQASGTQPLAYQWRHDGQPIANATSTTYSITAAQAQDGGNYDVIVTNLVNSITSAPAVLTVRTARNLVWIGSFNADWDPASQNWDSNNDNTADTTYIEGDNALFNAAGAAAPNINLLSSFHPNAVLVNADLDYLFSTPAAGAIVGTSRLTKQGFGTLTLDTDNTYTGPTVIEAGRLTVGAGDFLGATATRGSLGTGPITNNGTLRFDRVGTLAMSNAIAGSGDLIKDNSLSLRLLGSNTMSGPVTVNRGNLTVGSGSLGSVTSITLNGVGTGDGTTLSLRDGAVVGSGVSLSATAPDANNRAGILNESGTNILNGSITLNGAGPVIVRVAAGQLEVNGPIGGPAFADVISFRGAGTNYLRSQFSIPGAGMQKDDAGVWEMNSSNNSFSYLRMIAGTLKLLNNNALATAGHIRTDGGVLDLNGFNQTVAGLANYRATPVTTIANSSTTADSRLTVATSPSDAPWISGCVIADATAGGTRKVSLTLNGGATLVFTNANTFSGDTTISAGTLALTGNGAIVNSSPIIMGAGTTIDATARNDATLTLNSSQVIKGNGAFTVLGTVTNKGTIELKVNKSGPTLSNDSLNGATAIHYGGTLKLVVTASPALAIGDTFKLFAAGSYTGSFASITPAAPTLGLAWDTSTLSVDGTLRIKQGAPVNPTNIVANVVSNGTVLQIAWPADYTGWTLQAQTNGLNVGISTNWAAISGSAGTNQVWLPIVKGNGTVFYRLIYP